MKLTAPPSSSPPEPSEAAPAPTPATGDPWPRWFGFADVAAAVFALLLAFLLASFAARNSDVWLHLATGRAIANGQYSFGTDPFSYATAGRYWVNHAWLFDFVEYKVYTSLGAPALVVLKALSVLLAAGLLLAIRRRGQSLCPWVLVLVLALLAAAPRMLLAPSAASIVGLAVLMFLLFRLPAPAGSWKVPVLVGVLFALWSNLDEWFFLGPLALAMMLVGSIVPSSRSEEESALGPPTSASTLAKALAIGLLACMLNPHHIHVWQLPVEITGSAAMANEPLFQRIVLLGPLDSVYIYNERFGSNINGAAYAALLVLGAVVLGISFGMGRLRLGRLLLWLAFAILSLRNVAIIPFFAIVSVPILAGQLNVFTSRFRPGELQEGKFRLSKLLATVGRVVGVIALAVLCVLAWPGWLHPKPDFASETPRVAWGIVADPSMKQTAEQIEAWRQNGSLAPDEHGILLSLNLGNYCAWFAPSEKVFANTRYRLHEPELGTYTMLRSNVGTRPDAGTEPNSAALDEVFRKHGVSYLGHFEAGRSIIGPVNRLLRDEDHWALWSLGGRAALYGWRPSPKEGKPSFEALRFDPVREAFRAESPRSETVADVVVLQTFLDDLFPPEPRAPLDADTAVAWMEYMRDVALPKVDAQDELRRLRLRLLDWGATIPSMPIADGNLPRPIQGNLFALPLLALRSARQAITSSPEHADGYFALSLAVNNPQLPMEEAERRSARVFAMQECLRRVSRPEQGRNTGSMMSPARLAGELAEQFLDNGDVDLRQSDGGFARIVGLSRIFAFTEARKALTQAIEYADAELAQGPNPGLANEREKWSATLKRLENVLIPRNGEYQDFRARNSSVAAQYEKAINLGLMDSAADLIKDADLKREFGPIWPIAAIQRIGIELYLGRVQEANEHLAALEAMIRSSEPVDVQVRAASLRLSLMLARVIGDYTAAATILEGLRNLQLSQLREFPPPSRVPDDLRLVLTRIHAQPVVGLAIGATADSFRQMAAYYSYLQTRRNIESEYHFSLGLLRLFEGNNAEAAANFSKIIDYPRNVPLSPPRQMQGAMLYLSLLEAAKRGK